MKKIGIVGNIGAGKTTLCRLLESKLNEMGMNYTAIYEKNDDNPYMEDFYKDMYRWAFNSQIYFLRKKFETECEMLSKEGCYIIDRTIYEDVNIMAKNLYLGGMMEVRDWDNYMDTYELMEHFISTPDVIVYLKHSTNDLVQNIINRGRDYEKNIDIAYVHALNELYDDFYENYDGEKVIIDCDGIDFEHNPNDLEMVIEKIKKYL